MILTGGTSLHDSISTRPPVIVHIFPRTMRSISNRIEYGARATSCSGRNASACASGSIWASTSGDGRTYVDRRGKDPKGEKT